MTPKVKESKAFAEWFADWIAIIQQNRASVERRARVDAQEHSDGANDPKQRAATVKQVP
jgi:hypothetical protein